MKNSCYRHGAYSDEIVSDVEAEILKHESDKASTIYNLKNPNTRFIVHKAIRCYIRFLRVFDVPDSKAPARVESEFRSWSRKLIKRKDMFDSMEDNSGIDYYIQEVMTMSKKVSKSSDISANSHRSEDEKYDLMQVDVEHSYSVTQIQDTQDNQIADCAYFANYLPADEMEMFQMEMGRLREKYNLDDSPIAQWHANIACLSYIQWFKAVRDGDEAKAEKRESWMRNQLKAMRAAREFEDTVVEENPCLYQTRLVEEYLAEKESERLRENNYNKEGNHSTEQAEW